MQTETQVAIVTSLFAGATLAWWFASRNNNKSAEKDNELATRLISYTQSNDVAGLREMLNNKNEMKKLLTVADTDNNTPLIMALKNGYEEAARILVNEFGQNIEAINNDGWNCFLSACFSGSMELVQLVHTKMNIKDIKEEEIMNSKNNDGWTGLHVSSAKGFQEIVKFLVDHGANVNLKNGAGHTPVLLSACNGFLEIVKYLVDHGADTTLKTEKLESPLFMSIRGNRKEIAEYLLSLPAADLHYINSSTLTGATALHAAARMGMVSTVSSLLSKGADINAQERDGSSPLHASIVQNKPEIAQLLVERGADINTKTRFGVTPLHDASFYGRPQIVKLLLEHGADTTQRDNDGLTPLHIICTASTSNRGNSKDGDHVAAIRELLAHGADVNTLDEGNSNPLYIATFAGEMGQKLVPVLLEYGANYTDENFQGWTPLHAAHSSLGNAETAKILEEHAKIHNPDFLASFNPNKPRDLRRRKNKINLGPGIFGENGPSLEAVAEMIKSEKIKNVVVLLGAGISVSAGIPDFRSPNSGIYSQETCKKYGLANPSAAFDIGAIRKDPVPFYHLVKDIFYPVTTGHFKPTKTHKFVTLLKEKGVLSRVYTQNIDGLEYIAGLEDKDVVEAHGSFKEAYCMKCRKSADMDAFWKAVGSEKVPICSSCGDTVRPNVTFFGEPLPSRFFENSMQDLRAADLLIVMGTSLKVYPFAALVNDVSSTTPRLLINRDEVGPFKGCAVNRKDKTEAKDKEDNTEGENELTEDEKRRDEEERKSGRDLAWLGECDDGVQQLVNLLGWEL